MDLAIDKIRTDGGTQPRAVLIPSVIDDYAEAMEGGAKFPPVTVFYDGTDYWLADGFHRVNAAQQNSTKKIEADVKQGTQRDAILHSVGANSAHGERRTNEDKRRAVETLLNDDEWVKWSNAEIARRCAVSEMTVSRHRPESHSNNVRVRTDKHGNTSTMNTSNIGRRIVTKEEYEAGGEIVDAETGEVFYARSLAMLKENFLRVRKSVFSMRRTVNLTSQGPPVNCSSFKKMFFLI